MNTKEKIEVMQAYLVGKTIQIKMDKGWEDWIAGEPNWDWRDTEYRIKPESLEFFCIEIMYLPTKVFYHYFYPSEDSTKERIKNWSKFANWNYVRTFKVREIPNE